MAEQLYPEHPVILIDDERDVLESQALTLRLAGISNLITCWDSRQAATIFQRHPTALVILDLMMPEIDGRELLDLVTQNYPQIVVVILTGVNDIQTAVECVRKGALDYIPKPVDQNRLVTSIRNALDHQRTVDEAQRLGRSLLSTHLEKPEAFAEFLTQDRTMLDIFRYLEALAPTNLPVLLTGETGVGKEILARAIHRASGRRGHFVAVDTAGLDLALFSDALFGHRTGAYTGAHRDRPGLIQRAANGTLFLDEIGDLNPESQIKLLRLLQEGTYYPLGSEIELRSNARVVAATNRSLQELAASPSFRKDLFYRLRSHHAFIPPLRQRKDDIPLLLDWLMEEGARQQHKHKPRIPRELYSLLRNYDFPGNVRELQGLVNDSLARHQRGVLSIASFRDAILNSGARAPENLTESTVRIEFGGSLPTLKEAQTALVVEALRRTQGNKKMAAELIGISRQTLRDKLRELQVKDWSAE